MKKIIFAFLLLPSLVFGQVTGKIIANRSGGGAISVDTINAGSLFNLHQTSSGQTITIPSPGSTKTIDVVNIGSVDVTISPGGTLSPAPAGNSRAQLRWTGSVWAVTLGSSGSGSDTSAVHKTGGETISGIKTFTISPSVPTPTVAADAVNKLYVDNANTGKVNVSGDTMTGILDAGSHDINHVQNLQILNGGQIKNVASNATIELGTNGEIDFTSGADIDLGATKNVIFDCDTAKVNGKVKIVDGSQGLNKVLTSDANGNASWQTASSGSGTVTNVSSANSDISVATGTTTPVLTLNSGSGANQIVKRNGSGTLDNADLPSGVDAYLTPVGTIITEPWTNLSSWTTAAGTFSASGGTLTMTGGANASPVYTNYIRCSGYGSTQYTNWTAMLPNIIVPTISSTTQGIAVGIQSQNTTSATSMHVAIRMDATNKGLIQLCINNSNTVLKTTVKPLLMNTGDNLTYVMNLKGNFISVCVTNNTVSPKESQTLIVNQQDILTNLIPNYGQFAIYELGGTVTAGSFSVVCNMGKRAIVAIGDSRTNGGANLNDLHLWHSHLSRMLRTPILNYSGNGNKIEDVNFSEITTGLDPIAWIILLGTNNSSHGDDSTATANKMKTLLDSIVAHGGVLGTNVFFFDELPRGSADLAGYSRQIRRTCGTVGCIQSYKHFLASSGTGPITRMFNADVLHPNYIGQYELAALALSYLPFAKENKPANYDIGIKAQNGNFCISDDFIIPTAPFSVCSAGSGSQIRIGPDVNLHGSLYCAASNNIQMQVGYNNNGSGNIATATSGGSIAKTSTGFAFTNFSGATIGAAPTLNTRFFVSDAGDVGIGTFLQNSTLQVVGSASFSYVAKTGTYSIAATDHTIDCTSGTFTVTLPTAVGISGRVYVVTNSGAGTITVATTSSQTIMGAATLTVNAGTSAILQSTNANWIKLN